MGAFTPPEYPYWLICEQGKRHGFGIVEGDKAETPEDAIRVWRAECRHDLHVLGMEALPVWARQIRAPMPTNEQVAMFEMFVQDTIDAPASHNCWVEAQMDTDGTMYVWTTEDELRIGRRFAPSGKMLGDLIV
jgi:hypothetical protein